MQDRKRNSWNPNRLVAGILAVSALMVVAGCGGGGLPEEAVRRSEPVEVEAKPANLAATIPPVAVDDAGAPEGIRILSDGDVKNAWRDAVRRVLERDFGGAIPILEVVAEHRVRDAGVPYVLGIALWKTGRLDEAERSLERTVEIDPQHFKGWLNLARVRMDGGHYTEAHEAASLAIGLNEESADALHQSGRALYALDRGDEAVEALEKALALEPSHGYAANTLGWILIREGRFEEAVQVLEIAREALPEAAFVRNNLGVAYERTDRRDDAISEFQAAVKAGDSNGKAAASLSRLGEPLVGGEWVASRP